MLTMAIIGATPATINIRSTGIAVACEIIVGAGEVIVGEPVFTSNEVFSRENISKIIFCINHDMMLAVC